MLQGSFAPKFGHHVVLQLCSNLLLRMQCALAWCVTRRFGSKQPAFPLVIVQSILLESGVKLGDVTIYVNESCLYSKGAVVKEYKELCEDELEKNELRWGRERRMSGRVTIMVGAGSTRCEGITTEWNDRIMKRFEVFCSNCKIKREEKPEGKDAKKSKTGNIVFSI